MPTATPQAKSLSVTPAIATLTVGGTQALTAQVTGDADVDQSVTWSSNNTQVATVDASGKVTAVATGTAVITATSKATPSVAGTATISVVGGVDLTPLFGTFNVNATKTTDTGCSFAQTFTGQTTVSANKDGSAATIRMIEKLTREYSGTVATSGAYTGAGTGNLSGFTYSGTITGNIGGGGTTITGTETLNFTSGCPGKMVIYQFSGTK
jgi:uncharacterized protein YjdB